MKVEVKKIEKNELIDNCHITLRVTDPKYKNQETDEKDPEHHTLAYINFQCKEKEIKNRIESETHQIWLRFGAKKILDPEEVLGAKEFYVDSETGELKKKYA